MRNSIVDSLGSAVSSSFNSLTGVISALGDGIHGIFTSVAKISSLVEDGVGDVLDSIVNLPSKIVSGIIDGIKVLLFPREGFVADRFGVLNEKLSAKLSIGSYTDLLKSFSSESGSRMPNITVTVLGTTSTIISFDSFYKVKPITDRYVSGFLFILLVLYNINMVNKLIRNSDVVGGGSGDSDTKTL